MKTDIIIKKSVVITILVFSISLSFAQFFPTGGYQGGLYGSGGDETFQLYLPEPRGLTAISADEEVYLEWDKPLPVGEIKHDDGTAEAWYYLSDPSYSTNLFYVRFVAPINGAITDIAVLSGADSEAYWDEIFICPDDGFGSPDISALWESFPNVEVNTSPVFGGAWNILNLSVPHNIANRDTFYVVTRWPDGSTVEPFLGTDTDSNSGNSAWSMDDGASWSSWPENFIMRAYITDSNSKGVVLKSEENSISAYTSVTSIANGAKIHYKSTHIASSIKVPKISVVGNYNFKSLASYSIYRSETQGGIYTYVDSETGLSFVDNTVLNNTEYFYFVTANYTEGESTYSNNTMAYPQGAEILPYSNNFDVDNGNFYGRDDWEWGTPFYVNGPVASSSPNVWGTVLNGDYSNSTFSWLILPFDMGEPGIHTLSFANWFDTESGGDFAYLAIDHDNNGIYYILDTYSASSGGWINENLIIHDSLSSPYAKLAFILESDNVNTNAGFYIDDFVLDRNIELELTVFLEGPFNGINMNTELSGITDFPLSQPYSGSPWNYGGSENVAAIPTDVVDWVLIELRDAADVASALPGTMIAQQAAFLLNDGSVVGLDGSSILSFNHTIIQSLFIVIWHRNHLPVFSQYALVNSGHIYSYDFTSGASQALGGNQSDLGAGKYGMIGGDANADGTINDIDGSGIWYLQAGLSGYLSGDVNMNTQVVNQDKNDIWLKNNGKSQQLPE